MLEVSRASVPTSGSFSLGRKKEWARLMRECSGPEQMVQAMAWWAMEECFGEIREPHPGNEEEQERLANLLLTLRDRSLALTYIPHPKQSWFHQARCRTRLFCGSNQSGKTTALLLEIVSWCLGFYPWSGKRVIHPTTGLPVKTPIRAMIGGEDYTTAIQETIVPKLKEIIPFESMVQSVEKTQGRTLSKIYFHNGSSIKFMSYESDPSKWEGQTYHIAGFDEPPPQHAYTATKRGLMRHLGPCLFSMTPLKEPWIHDDIYDDDSAVHVMGEADLAKITHNSYFVTTVSQDDNPHLTEEAKREFIKGLDEEEREARIHGRFKHLMGLVYRTFRTDHHVIGSDYAYDPGWPSGLVVDPHDRKPFACAWFVVNPRGELIWIHEWPDFDFYGTKSWGWGVKEYKESWLDQERRLGLTNVVWRIMDPNFGRTQSASTGQTLQEDFEDTKDGTEPSVYFECTVDNDLTSGHIAVRRWLGDPDDPERAPQMFFMEHCHNLIKGMTHYTWDEWKMKEKGAKEKPKERFKDFPDLVRYAIKSEPAYFDPGVEVHKMGSYKNLGYGRKT